MVIGMLKLPNKLSTAAGIHGSPVIYSNGLSQWDNIGDSWGGIISVSSWFHNFKIITQDNYHIVEYWCVVLADGTHNEILVPIVMKRFGYGAYASKCFLMPNSINDLLIETNRYLPEHNSLQNIRLGVNDTMIEILEAGELFKKWGEVYRRLYNSGAFHTRFKSGQPITVPELLRQCVLVDPYAKTFLRNLNDADDLEYVGIASENQLVNFLYEGTPCEPNGSGVDVDWIGECILGKNLRQFSFNDIESMIMVTPQTNNLMNILRDTVKREELINIPALSLSTIPYDYMKFNYLAPGMHDSTVDDVREFLDEVCNCLMLSEATTIVLEYSTVNNLDGKNSRITDRVFGYGLCSSDCYSGNNRVPSEDQIFFYLHDILEAIDANYIRCIKTFNEELFITVRYNNGTENAYYINLFVHACVSGCLFSV